VDPIKAALLHIGRAWNVMLALEFADAWAEIAAAEWNIAGLSAADAAPILREIRLLQAASYALGDDSTAALATAQAIAEGEGHSATIAKTICRFAYWKRRDFEAMRGLRAASLKTYRARSIIPAVIDISMEAAAAFELLRIPIARRLTRDAILLTETAFGRQSAAAALPASIAAQLAYEEDRLDDAENLIGDRFPAVRARGNIECAIRAFIVMARVSARRGQTDIAAQILNDAEELAERRGWPRLRAASLRERLEIMLACGRLDEAKLSLSRLEQLAGSPRLGDHLAHADIRRYALIGRARVERTITPSSQLAAVFRRLHRDALRREQLFEALQLTVWLADVLAVTGEIDKAAATLRNALDICASVGLYRILLDGGEAILDLLRTLQERLRAAADSDEATLYLDSLLSLGAVKPQASSKATNDPRGSHISKRELAIIKLIGTGLPNKQIAQSLGITPETVKTHMKNIFVKLSVTTRTEAVRRAQTFGLI
jgi:ATP/maltotriose-dependent transcriptional regulator MalT